MPARLAKTKKHRQKKAAKHGVSSKRKRENHGTTVSFPATGALPTTRYGVAVKADSVVIPAKLTAKPKATAQKATK